jgi:hypothetical protein
MFAAAIALSLTPLYPGDARFWNDLDSPTARVVGTVVAVAGDKTWFRPQGYQGAARKVGVIVPTLHVCLVLRMPNGPHIYCMCSTRRAPGQPRDSDAAPVVVRPGDRVYVRGQLWGSGEGYYITLHDCAVLLHQPGP